MFALSQTMYLFEANLNLLANTSTPDVAQYHLEENLNASCLHCWSTGLTKREKYPCNTIQVWRCTPTNARTAKPAMIPLTGGTMFLSEILSEDINI